MSRILFVIICSAASLLAQIPSHPAAVQSLCVAASTGLPALPPGVVQPAPPKCTMPVYPVVTGTSWPVHAGGNLQTVLNGVSCGDEVVIDAGALFSGTFVTPLINCAAKPVLVRSASIASLPA